MAESSLTLSMVKADMAKLLRLRQVRQCEGFEHFQAAIQRMTEIPNHPCG